MSPQTVDDVLNSGLASIADFVDCEIDTLVQRSAVYPLLACVPAFHGGRIQQCLAH